MKNRNIFILAAAMALIVGLAGCSNMNDINNPEQDGKVSGRLESYHPEVAFDEAFYRDALIATINKDDAAAPTADQKKKDKSITDTIINFVWEKAVSVATTQGMSLVNVVKDTLIEFVKEFAMEKLKEILDVEHNAMLRKLFKVNDSDNLNVYAQIRLLADSQDIMQTKLDSIMSALSAQTLSAVINEKASQYSEIQSVNSKAMDEIQAVYDTYKDIYEKPGVTEEEIQEADTIVTMQVDAILAEWGNKIVHGNTSYLNADILLDNYTKKWSTGVDYGDAANKTYIEIYDAIAKRVYGWEHEGYAFRQMYRTVDAAVLSEAVLLTSMYYKSIDKPDLIKNLQTKYGDVVNYMNRNKVNMDYTKIVCQIPGVEYSFQREMWMKTGSDYRTAIYSYTWLPGWFDSVPARYDFANSDTAERMHFAICHDDYDSYKKPKLLSMNEYKKIVDYYNNKYTLREIFINFAKFSNATDIYEEGNTAYMYQNYTKSASYLLNSNSGSEWFDGSYEHYDYMYWAVTNMNRTTLPLHNSDWNKRYHGERDFRFLVQMNIQQRMWGGHYSKDSAFTEVQYNVFYPIVIQ